MILIASNVVIRNISTCIQDLACASKHLFADALFRQLNVLYAERATKLLGAKEEHTFTEDHLLRLGQLKGNKLYRLLSKNKEISAVLKG